MDRKHRSHLRQVKSLSVRVKKLSPKENDLVVMRYESDVYTEEELENLFQTLADGLNRPVIAIPYTMELTTENCEDMIADLQSLMKGGTE